MATTSAAVRSRGPGLHIPGAFRNYLMPLSILVALIAFTGVVANTVAAVSLTRVIDRT
mgnify:CR=1 FL=1